MNKSRYKLYKQGKKWVITAVAATSIGIGGYSLNTPYLAHAFDERFASVALQTINNDGDFYKVADYLSMAAKSGGSAESDYESFKSALAVYEISKDINSTFYNDLRIISQYNTGIPSYITDNQLQLLNSRFNELYPAVVDAYYHHNNGKALSIATSYIDQASSVINFHKNRIYEPIGSLASKDALLASSASSAISNVISSYNMVRNGSKYSQSSFFASSAPAASENVPNSTPNKDASYWQNVANSLSAEMVKKSNANSVATVAPSSSTETSAASSTATSVTSSATSSAATSSSSTDGLAVSSRADDFLYTSHDSIASSSSAITSSAAKPKKDVYKNFYLSLKKKAVKEVTSNKNRVAKYKKEYKLTKNKQQKANKLKQYRDAKIKLKASQKHLKSINAKSLKY